MCRCHAGRRTSRRRESYRKDIEVRVKDKQWLRGVIKHRGMTVAQAAAKAQVAETTLYHLVNTGASGRWTCSLDTAVRIAGALEWDLHDLFVPKVSTVREGQRPAAQRSAA